MESMAGASRVVFLPCKSCEILQAQQNPTALWGDGRMRIPALRVTALSAAVLGCIPFAANAQQKLEEVIVTATRRETSLQSTPISIQAFTGRRRATGDVVSIFRYLSDTPS
jgi:outer membrane receptor protein involved in Fe transport